MKAYFFFYFKYVSRSTLVYRALYYGKVGTLTSYILHSLPPPFSTFSIDVKLNPGYTCLKFSSCVDSQPEPTDWRSLTAV